MDDNSLLVIILAFMLGCMCSGMMKQMCGNKTYDSQMVPHRRYNTCNRLIEGSSYDDPDYLKLKFVKNDGTPVGFRKKSYGDDKELKITLEQKKSNKEFLNIIYEDTHDDGTTSRNYIRFMFDDKIITDEIPGGMGGDCDGYKQPYNGEFTKYFIYGGCDCDNNDGDTPWQCRNTTQFVEYRLLGDGFVGVYVNQPGLPDQPFHLIDINLLEDQDKIKLIKKISN